jgi:tripartite-type tricarboxylate transporter receptor subunit TctC
MKGDISMIKSFLTCAALGIAAAVAPAVVTAQAAWPDKPLRLVVGYSPGGSVDVVARVFAQALKDSLGQTVLVENRTGAGGAIGADFVAKAEPDGYRLLLQNSGTFDNALLSKTVPYNVLRDFTPIAFVGAAPRVLAVGPSVPARNVEELFKAARAKPGDMRFASEGNGNSSHLGLERLAQMAHLKLMHVPYKGGPDALLATASGDVDMTMLTLTTTLPMLRSGKLRPLAVTTLRRSSLLPEVPTLDESGVKGFDQSAWFGIVGPANMPKDVVEKLRAAIYAAAEKPELRETLARQAVEVELKSPEQFGAFMRDYAAQIQRVVQQANIKMD